MDLLEKLQILPEFSDFTEDELYTLSKAFVVKDYPDEYEFIREGERGDTLFFLIEGTVQVVRLPHDENRKEYIERLLSGSIFGLISLIDHGKRSATCRAQGNVTVASLPRNAFDLLCNANAKLAQHFQFIIAKQLARDMRIYNRALSQMIVNENKTAFYGTLRAASYEYRGIERRKQERRGNVERRQRIHYWNDFS